jgi:hypothetical protein
MVQYRAQGRTKGCKSAKSAASPSAEKQLRNAASYQGGQGSMLWSQFSAIFPNFRRKNWRFS